MGLWALSQAQTNPKILGASLLTHVTANVVGHSFGDPGSFPSVMLPSSSHGLLVFQGPGKEWRREFSKSEVVHVTSAHMTCPR